MPPASIVDISAAPLDIALTEPFGIATGAQLVASNVLIRVELEDGSVGTGEAAPFPAVNGETQATALTAIAEAAPHLRGLDARRWRHFAARTAELVTGAASARAGLEMALLDALCRRAQCSLWDFFGGSEPELVSDITIPTGSAEHASDSATRALADGFTTLKVKVGGNPLEHDLERVRAVMRAAPNARLVLDANASMSSGAAIALLRGLGRAAANVALFEQPTAADDLSGLREVREAAHVAVAADESARSAADVAKLAVAGACDVVNVKIMKTGVAEALDMIAAARAHGLGLMIGGMVESRLAMTVSACLAGGQGGFSFVDLDTPLFMRNSPMLGGFVQSGARLRVDHIELGHGICVTDVGSRP